MTDNSKNQINVSKIEKLLSTSSTSSIYDTLAKIQQGEITKMKDEGNKLDIDFDGFSIRKSLSDATSQEFALEEKTIEPVSESISLPPSEIQEIEKTATQYQVSIISVDSKIESYNEFEKTLLKVGGRKLEFSLKAIITDKHSEELKTEINSSDAGIIVLPPFADINDIQMMINKHVSELWSFNGLGPIPFIIVVLEDNIRTGSLAVNELEQSVKAFIDNLTPITRGNYGFGIKFDIIKSLEFEGLKRVLRSLAILLISYNRFMMQKNVTGNA